MAKRRELTIARSPVLRSIVSEPLYCSSGSPAPMAKRSRQQGATCGTGTARPRRMAAKNPPLTAICFWSFVSAS